MPWKYTFSTDADSYRSQHRSKAIEEARVHNLKNELAQTKASISGEVTRQVEAAMDTMRRQGILPAPPTDMLSPEHPSQTRVIRSSCASTELLDQRYPMDEIQYRTCCELHIPAMNLTTRVAYSMTLPPGGDEDILEGYLVVSVGEVCEGYGELERPILVSAGEDVCQRLSMAEQFYGRKL